jgi:hypothetical protein
MSAGESNKIFVTSGNHAGASLETDRWVCNPIGSLLRSVEPFSQEKKAGETVPIKVAGTFSRPSYGWICVRRQQRKQAPLGAPTSTLPANLVPSTLDSEIRAV